MMMKLTHSERTTNDSLVECVQKTIETSQANDNDMKALSAIGSPDLRPRDLFYGPVKGSQRSTICTSQVKHAYNGQYNCFGMSLKRRERGRSTDGNFPIEELKEVAAPLSPLYTDGEQIDYDPKVAFPFLYSSDDDDQNDSGVKVEKLTPNNKEEKSEIPDKHSKYEFIQVSSKLNDDLDNHRFNREKKTRIIQPQFYSGYTHDFCLPVSIKTRQFATKNTQQKSKAQGSTFDEGLKNHAPTTNKLESKTYARKTGWQQKRSRK